jgi:hypothetical protein
LAFDIPNDIKQDLGVAPIGLGRLIDELFNNDQQLADFPTPAILGDYDAFVQRFVQQSLQIFGTRRAALRIAGPAFLETTVRGRLAKESDGRPSRRRAARVVDVGLPAQTVKPVIKRGAEQRHHFGDKLRRVLIGLPAIVVR